MLTRIALDAMGGDNAPDVVLEGAVLAARELKEGNIVLLVGPENIIKAGLEKYDDIASLPIEIMHAPEVVGMAEKPAAALKGKPKSSIHVGIEAVKSGYAQAFTSAGNTGAIMAVSQFRLGRIKGVARPTLASYYPTVKGFCILMDVGANVDCKPEHLVQFAQMGSVYASKVMGIKNPVIGLMNVGEEPGKGNAQAKEVSKALHEVENINFKGNIEGFDILPHNADVVVCDGFVGNILLKFGESLTHALGNLAGQVLTDQKRSPADQKAVMEVLGGIGARFNADNYGGAPLLGVKGNVTIGHGASSSLAIKQSVLGAIDMIENKIVSSIEETLSV